MCVKSTLSLLSLFLKRTRCISHEQREFNLCSRNTATDLSCGSIRARYWLTMMVRYPTYFSCNSSCLVLFSPTAIIDSIDLLCFALIGAESLVAVIAPLDNLLVAQVSHALKATVVLRGKRLSDFLTVNHVRVLAARTLEALWDVAGARACDHLLLVLDVILAVEALWIVLLGASGDKQVVTIVAWWDTHIGVPVDVFRKNEPAITLLRLEDVLLATVRLFGNKHFFILCVSFLIHPRFQLVPFLQFSSLFTKLSFLLRLLAHVFVAAHELNRHLWNESGNRLCLSLVFFLRADLNNARVFGPVWLLFFYLNSILHRLSELLLDACLIHDTTTTLYPDDCLLSKIIHQRNLLFGFFSLGNPVDHLLLTFYCCQHCLRHHRVSASIAVCRSHDLKVL